jgi:hypothetical protein
VNIHLVMKIKTIKKELRKEKEIGKRREEGERDYTENKKEEG